MTSDDMGGVGRTPTNPIRSMALLEQTPTLSPAIITGETSNEDGSIAAVILLAEQERPANEGQPPSVVVSSTSALTQTPHLPIEPTGALSSEVGDLHVTPVLFQ